MLALDPDLLGSPDDARNRLEDLAGRVTASGGRVPGSRRTPPADLDDNAELAVDHDVLDDLMARAGASVP